MRTQKIFRNTKIIMLNDKIIMVDVSLERGTSGKNFDKKREISEAQGIIERFTLND
jgi:hypothetical protein